MNPLRSPLYRRLLLWFCAANVATLLVSVFATERLARMAYVDDPDWPQLAQDASDRYLHDGADGLGDWSESRRREGIDATLFEGERNLLDRPPPPPVRRALPKLLDEDSVVLRPRPEQLIAGQRIVGSDGIARHLIAVRGPRPPHARIEEVLAVQIALSLLVIAVLGWWIARSIARPVAALQTATQRMAAGELSARVGAKGTAGSDELARLSRDFDRMAARIETLVANERSVLQDVSHELRSPLARLHLLLDLARHAPAEKSAQHFERAEREIERLDRLIGETLALSRMEAELPGMMHERIDFTALVTGRISEMRLDAEARDISLSLTTGRTDVTISGSSSLLERAVDNLLSNAIKFSPAGSRIEVTQSIANTRVELIVRDHGAGIPEDELTALFRPYFRGSNAALAEGHGLGLAIVRRIVLAHGGEVRVENADGGGLRASLSLPLSA